MGPELNAPGVRNSKFKDPRTEADSVPHGGAAHRARQALVPGLAATAGVAVLATVLGARIPAIGISTAGLILGFLVSNILPVPEMLKSGISFASGQLLRVAIVLMGARISFRQAMEISGRALWIIVGTLVVALVVTSSLGRMLRISTRLVTLLGVGTAICGASAITATAPIVKASKEETAYALGAIFTLNLLALLVFPFVGHAMELSDTAFGTWVGTSIHDTSSVVAAGYSFSEKAGIQATVVKLTRIMFLVPIAFGIGLFQTTRYKHGRARGVLKLHQVVPGFVVGFTLMSLANSFGLIADGTRIVLDRITGFLIVMALSGIGLQTRLKSIHGIGVMPLLLGLIAFLAVALWSLAWIRIVAL